MADTAYKYTSNKDPFNETTSIIVAGSTANPEKVIVRGGDPVLLSEEEHDRISAIANLRKHADQSEVNDGEPKADAAAEAVAENNDQTSVAPNAGAARATSPGKR